MRYRKSGMKRSTRRRNPYLEPVGIDPGSVWMHTGYYRVEPVEFLGFTKYGAGRSWGDPSQVEVRSLDSGKVIATTVDRLRPTREGEIRKNPSAVYGAFKTNGDLQSRIRATLRKYPKGLTQPALTEKLFPGGQGSEGQAVTFALLAMKREGVVELGFKAGSHYSPGHPKFAGGDRPWVLVWSSSTRANPRGSKPRTLEEAVRNAVRAVRSATGAVVEITPNAGGRWCVSGLDRDVIKSRPVLKAAGLRFESSEANDPDLPGERFDYWSE